MAARRPYGSGQLYQERGSWYGRWYAGKDRVWRKLGPVRRPSEADGLTRAQAEAQLRQKMADYTPQASASRVLTVKDAGERLIDHLEALGRKPSTIGVYRSLLRTHLAVHMGDAPLDRVSSEQVERMIATMRRKGAGPKVTVNALTLLGQVFEFGTRRRWCSANPCKLVDRPRVEEGEEIRFLDAAELEALLRATPDPTDRVLFLTAAMTGLRQGELLALQWQDVDWIAGRIRVRRNYVRGHWGTPMSRRSSRAVPMADRLAGELERHYKRSPYQGDGDLVFGHPDTGAVLDHSGLVRRFKAALRAAGVRPVRFHDLRHTFGTRMAAAGVPMRTLQEWLGHRDFKTTLRYADYAPSTHEAEMVERALRGTVPGSTVPLTIGSGSEG